MRRAFLILNILYTARLLLLPYLLIHLSLASLFESFAGEGSNEHLITTIATFRSELFPASLGFYAFIFLLVFLGRLPFQRTPHSIPPEKSRAITAGISEFFGGSDPLYLTNDIATRADRQGIFLSLNDAFMIEGNQRSKNTLLFILHHEALHRKILDPYLDGVQRSALLIFTFFVALVLSSPMEIALSGLGAPAILALVLPVALAWPVCRYVLLAFHRAKECFCDRHAALLTEFADGQKSRGSIARRSWFHPGMGDRCRCANGDLSPALLAMLLFSGLILTSAHIPIVGGGMFWLCYGMILVEVGIAATTFFIVYPSRLRIQGNFRLLFVTLIFGCLLSLQLVDPSLFFFSFLWFADFPSFPVEIGSKSSLIYALNGAYTLVFLGLIGLALRQLWR